MLWKPCQPKQTHSLDMYQAALYYYVWNRFFYSLENTFMTICGNTFDPYTKFDQVIKIFFYLMIMFSVCKPDQLSITVIMILVAKHTKLMKVGGVHPQMNIISLYNFNDWRLF